MATSAMLRVEGLVQRFDAADETITALDHVSFDVAQGEVLSVIGPSGCGQSTVFNIIGGLTDADEGRVSVEGQPVSGPPPAIGMVFQEESTFPWRTVVENIAFPLEIAGEAKDERVARAREYLALVGLQGFERHYPAELSGGMRQRVAIARTLASRPKILLMDEPFAALDEQTRFLLGDKVLQIQQKLAQTTLLVTHTIAQAVQLSDRVVVMTYRPGRVKQVVAIDLPRPRTSEVAGSVAFQAFVAEIWNDRREEASRGMLDAEAHSRRRAGRPTAQVGSSPIPSEPEAVGGHLTLPVWPPEAV